MISPPARGFLLFLVALLPLKIGCIQNLEYWEDTVAETPPTSGDDDDSPGDDDASSGDDDVSSGDDDVSSGDDDVSSGDDDVSSGDDDVSSGDDDVSSGDDDVSSGDDDVSSGDDDVSSGDDDVLITETPSTTPAPDNDLDGYSAIDDCDDTNAEIHPDAPETCDGIDSDCDFLDLDNDQDSYDGCAEDCDDNASEVNPGAIEVCDTIDNNCDSLITADLDGDGEDCLTDCDDYSAATNSRANEICDGMDNDCDGEIDESLETKLWYVDADQDGFGDDETLQSACVGLIDPTAAYLSEARGDCDDTDNTFHPGASDPEGGADQDCGGTSASDPHVGLPASTYTTIQSALYDANNNQVIWVGPGTYEEHSISYAGLRIALRSTHGAASTIIDGESGGAVLEFNSNEGNEAILDGFTITNGKAELITLTPVLKFYLGGGAYIEESRPTIKNCIFSNNTATDSGGGIYAYDADPSIIDCQFIGNEAYLGGAMGLESAEPEIIRTVFKANTAITGAAICITAANPTVEDSSFLDNQASGDGGAVANFGGSFTAVHSTFSGQQADSQGGVIYSYGGSVSLQNSVIFNNEASTGGAIYLDTSSASIIQSTVYGNRAASYGGAFYLYASSPTLDHSIIAYNTNGNIYRTSTSSVPVLKYCDIYNAIGLSHNLDSLGTSVLEIDPLFLVHTLDHDASNDELILHPLSPLIDAGDPGLCSDAITTGCDPDGTIADIGAYGGPNADFSVYADADQDGILDRWEAYYLYDSTLRSDSNSDRDADGISALTEYLARTDPNDPDSDNDQASDSDEIDADSDPLDPQSLPSGPIIWTLADGDDIATYLGLIPEWKAAQIELTSGSYNANLSLNNQGLILTGLDDASEIFLDGNDDGSVITAQSADLNISNLTIKNGMSDNGAGIRLSWSRGKFDDIILNENNASSAGGGVYAIRSELDLSGIEAEGNSATNGGVLYLASSQGTISDAVFSENEASDSGAAIFLASASYDINNAAFFDNTNSNNATVYASGSTATITDSEFSGNNTTNYGGALYITSASFALDRVHFSDNYSGYYSGAIYCYSSTMTANECLFESNIAATYYGGVMEVRYSTVALTQCTLTGNRAGSSGGGIYAYDTDLNLYRTVLNDNQSDAGNAGAMYLSNSTVALNNVGLSGNSASSYGGALYGYYSTLTGSHCLIARNTGSEGGGVYLYLSTTVTLTDSIIAYNLADNGGNLYRYDTSNYLTLNTSDLYNPSAAGYGNDNFTPSGTYYNDEPGFLSYEYVNGNSCSPARYLNCAPVDPHLALTSTLIDRGDSTSCTSETSSACDPDGSPPDLGIYGGPDADGFNRDFDDYFDYFWPGAFTDAPAGFNSSDYDQDDFDENVH